MKAKIGMKFTFLGRIDKREPETCLFVVTNITSKFVFLEFTNLQETYPKQTSKLTPRMFSKLITKEYIVK